LGSLSGAETAVTTTLSCVTAQKSSELIYTAAEVWNKELWFSPVQYKSIYNESHVQSYELSKIKIKNRNTILSQKTGHFN
jgi:hypothetical protein